MQLLVLGLDGMDQQLMELFDMPVLSEVVKQNTTLPIREDLWTRGWVEILSGLPGESTGAFYEKPAANGTPKFTQRFGTGDYSNLANPPAWEAMTSLGVRSIWFNLPTTMPAATLDGVMVSGAGGGVSPSDRIPREACHPPCIRDELKWSRMIWENRFRVSGLRSADTYIPTCIDAIWQRAHAFCRLAKQKPDMRFGFVVQKEIVLLTNVFMYDILNIRSASSGTRYAATQLLKQFFRELDDTLGYILHELQPDSVGVVSDHGAAPYEESVNLNEALARVGLTKTRKVERRHSKRPHDVVGSMLRSAAKRVLESGPYDDPPVAQFPVASPHSAPVDFTASKCFAHRYVPGVYVNDERFGGKQYIEKERSELVESIVAKINATPELKQREVVAAPFRELHCDSAFQHLLPDVWVNLPSNVFPEASGPLTNKNPLFRPWFNLSQLNRDIASGKKDPRAMCSFPKEIVEKANFAESPSNLTAAYHCMLAAF